MKFRILFLASILICPLSWCQDSPANVVEIDSEPHHRLLFKNQAVRVYRLSLHPGDVTLPHGHKTFYAFVSLRPVTLANEIQGRKPVLTELKASELHTSKGGFSVAERNMSPELAEVLVIEAIKADDGGSFSTPMGSFRLHDAAVAELFDAPVVRAYSMAISAGGRVEKHREDCDRLLVAVSDLSLREEVDGQPPPDLRMKAGDVRWVERGLPHSTMNVGSSPAAFITLEFK